MKFLRCTAVPTLILSCAISLANISEEQFLQIAHTYVLEVDGGFLSSRLSQGAVLENGFFEYKDFHIVHFTLIDRKQEELYNFYVQMLKANGDIVPANNDPVFCDTHKIWKLGIDNYCYFHPDDYHCYMTPI